MLKKTIFLGVCLIFAGNTAYASSKNNESWNTQSQPNIDFSMDPIPQDILNVAAFTAGIFQLPVTLSNDTKDPQAEVLSKKQVYPPIKSPPQTATNIIALSLLMMNPENVIEICVKLADELNKTNENPEN